VPFMLYVLNVVPFDLIHVYICLYIYVDLFCCVLFCCVVLCCIGICVVRVSCVGIVIPLSCDICI
jgi:hypothetical protein